MLGLLTKISSELLPKDTTEHRMKLLMNLKVKDEDLLEIGNDGTTGRPRKIEVSCQINDNLEPSYEDNYRLKLAFPGLYTVILPLDGHEVFYVVGSSWLLS